MAESGAAPLDQDGQAEDRRPPLTVLIASLREQLPRLVRGEKALLSAELRERRTKLTTGSIMLVMMLLVGFFGFAALVTAAVVAVDIALAAWLAALIVVVALLLVAAILVFIGLRKLRGNNDAH